MDIINLFDYATLKWIWWLFIGALLIGFAIMDGHDGHRHAAAFCGQNR